MESTSLNDSYKVYIYCTEDAGDYCNAKEIKTDEFMFDDGDFTTSWFDDQLWGFNEPGDYEENGPGFQATYQVYNKSAEKYEISIQGISLTNGLIVGTMNIEFYEWELLSLSFKKKDDTQAYFLGIK